MLRAQFNHGPPGSWIIHEHPFVVRLSNFEHPLVDDPRIPLFVVR
jgi:hypothetical protein